MKKFLKLGCIGTLVSVILFVGLAFMFPTTPTEATAPEVLASVPDAPTVAQAAPTVAPAVAMPTVTPAIVPWYVGGTLHDGTIADWQAGSAADKLATASDWYVTARGLENLREDDEPALRNLSVAMVTCLDTMFSEFASEIDVTTKMAAPVTPTLCSTYIATESDYAALAATLED